ncbi:MAG: hypothetical protein HY901_28190 [Deltaproteobacteria bacterium]|nr:hypothetical protein [Deltaproteobacteria bacterium]
MSARIVLGLCFLVSVAFSCSPDPDLEADASIGKSSDAGARRDAGSAADASAAAGDDAALPVSDAASGDSDAAQSEADAAQSEMDAAQSEMDAAQSEADAAQSELDAAQAEVDAGGLPDATASDLDAATEPGPDASTPDTGAVEADAGPAIGEIECGSSVCSGGDQCCLQNTAGTLSFNCASSCSGTTGSASCDGPEDCGNAELCCNTYSLGAGYMPNCPVESATITCSSTCTSLFQSQCPSSGVMRLCHSRADCVEPSYGNCCPSGVGQFLVCLPYAVGGCVN